MAPAELSINSDLSSKSRRSQSISSDRPSLGGYGGLLSPPSTVSPDPAFIAASAASQIVTNDHDSHADTWFDQHGIEPSGETALVAPPALKLVNRFLDQLLFNFLSISRSTSLASLRPAVAEVLKPKLAKEAISGADQELHEYLGGGEEEELLAFHNGLEPSRDWDLELVWKRTRLRCMVYSSLGDMEEEDEDFYTESEHLDGAPGSDNRFSNSAEVVSPAVAIFLTSVLEFMGEQALVVAGQAAYYRLKMKIEKEERDGTQSPVDIAERVVVEDSDMERVALDRTLGRLWRGWKKRVRSPTTSVSMSHSFSRESLRSQPQTRTASVGSDDVIHEDRRPSLAAVLAEHEHAASIPLPIDTNDIREIEVPGLAHQSDDEDEDVSDDEEEVRAPTRPKSMMFFVGSAAQNSPPSQLERPKTLGPRKRSNSVPSSAPLPFKSSKRQKPSVETANEEQLAMESENAIADADELTGAKENVTEEKKDGEKESATTTESKGVIAEMVTLGATAVAGIVAAAKGEAPQTSLVDTKEPEVVEEFNEEPQIMTSSRVSIGGRNSPEEIKEISSKRSSSIRSPSVHSLRLVDVTSPRSPARSREGSLSAADFVRPIVVSRPSSIYSLAQTPRVTSPVLRIATASPIVRHGSSHSVRRPRNSAGDSISEIDERDIDLVPSMPVPVESEPVYDEKSQPGAFAFNPAPTTRSTQGFTSSPRVENPASANLAIDYNTAGDAGVPPLTPLREMMDGARGTSDEYSSITPSTDAYSVTDNTNSLPSVEQQSQTRVNSRSSPPRSTAPEHIAKGQRSLHTSGSGSSSGSYKLKSVSTSEDSSRNVERKGQSFEQLIRSDQTIQYTLTPQNMRDIESPDSPRYSTPPIIPDARPMTGRSHSSSVGRPNGLNSNPPIEVARSIKSSKSFKPALRSQPSNSGTRMRPNAPQARDARVDRDSIGDFAEFIRSTGPANSYETMPTRSASTNRGVNGAPRDLSSAGPPRVGTATSLPKRTASSAGRSRLQARDAVVPRGDSVSDLIDFVRSGPQLEKQDHRIPRTVAPFRSTMDSDQMNGAVGGRAVDATIPDVRFSNTASVSSVNSQSALLNGSRNKTFPTQTRNEFEEEDMMPKRKTRRVRDPYAIDFSDEEDDDLFPSRPPPIKEESLAEFLRNAPPPRPEPVRTISPENESKSSSKKMKKKASSGSLMSRFGRSGSTSTSAPPIPSKPQSTDNENLPHGSRKTPLYTPITAKHNTPTPANEQPRNGSYVSQLDSARSNDVGRRKVVQKSYQPREAIYTSTRTSDLADFLLSSEPPSSMQTQPQTFAPVLQKDEANAFQRMFGRKKAH